MLNGITGIVATANLYILKQKTPLKNTKTISKRNLKQLFVTPHAVLQIDHLLRPHFNVTIQFQINGNKLAMKQTKNFDQVLKIIKIPRANKTDQIVERKKKKYKLHCMLLMNKIILVCVIQ